MEQYFPRAHVGKSRRIGRTEMQKILKSDKSTSEEDVAEHIRYADINRAVKPQEVESVTAFARSAGLWRLVEAAEHGGFNI
jgi:putative pyruvate formate lyase activating enzyme